MTGFRDVAPDKLITALAVSFEKQAPEVKPPEWAKFVKTGVNRERPPTQNDWWHVRAASMLRRIAMIGPVGTSKLRNHYGGSKNRGHKPDRWRPGSGNITRKILQQLEASGLVKHGNKGVFKGRIITPKGHSLLNGTAWALMKQAKKAPKPEVKEAPKQEAPKVEEKPKEAPKQEASTENKEAKE